MANIFPFKGWRYSKDAGDLSRLTFPLSIADNKSLQKEIAKDPLNILHLFYPENIKDASFTSQEWKNNSILVQDSTPAIYAYQQIYSAKDGKKRKLRGFICTTQLYDWKENIILRHEMTMPHSVKERLAITESTQLNVCPTHGLYTDSSLILESFLEDSLSNPTIHFYDSAGIENSLSIINDSKTIAIFINCLREKQIIIADGHHRYEAALAYRKNIGLDSTSNDSVNRHLFFLTNTESNLLDIYPTHRLIQGIPHFEKDKFMNNLMNFFEVTLIEPANVYREVRNGHHAFGLVFKNSTYVARLKEGLAQQIPWNFPLLIRELDLTILHYYIVEKGLGIEGKDQKYSSNIQFSFNHTKILKEVNNGDYQMAILTKDISQEEIKKVCYSGFTFPQKSTYFFPKVLCGIIMNSLQS